MNIYINMNMNRNINRYEHEHIWTYMNIYIYNIWTSGIIWFESRPKRYKLPWQQLGENRPNHRQTAAACSFHHGEKHIIQECELEVKQSTNREKILQWGKRRSGPDSYHVRCRGCGRHARSLSLEKKLGKRNSTHLWKSSCVLALGIEGKQQKKLKKIQKPCYINSLPEQKPKCSRTQIKD